MYIIGVAVPNIFARRYIAKDRQKFLQKELEERKGEANLLSGSLLMDL